MTNKELSLYLFLTGWKKTINNPTYTVYRKDPYRVITSDSTKKIRYTHQDYQNTYPKRIVQHFTKASALVEAIEQDNKTSGLSGDGI